MSRGLNTPHKLVAVAVYLPEQYPRFLATAEDGHDFVETWQEWYQVLQETRRNMAMRGIHLIDVTVDIDELEVYCQQQGLTNIARVRAQFAAHLLEQQQAQLVLKVRTGKKKRWNY